MRNQAFIWDLDGTLLDSYEVIVTSLLQVFESYHIILDREKTHQEVIRTSVSEFLHEMEKKEGIAFDESKPLYSKISGDLKMTIPRIKGAKETLDALAAQGAQNFVFTHRGNTTEQVLRNLDLYDCFKEIITSEAGFPRKPEPDGLLYLLDKHGLDKENTFYVGDRSLDMECAKNAGIRGILYLDENSCGCPSGMETWIVQHLEDILSLKL